LVSASFYPSLNNRTPPITTLKQNPTATPSKSASFADYQSPSAGSVSRKEGGEIIFKGLCRLCGEKWD